MRDSLEIRKQARLNLNKRFLGPLFPLAEKLHPGYGELTLKEYCNMQKKHLKAYLQGYPYFIYKNNRYKVDYTYGDQGQSK